MTETELKSQRSKALANYELLKMYQPSGRSTAAQVAEALGIYQALKNYQLTPADPAPARVSDPPAPPRPAPSPRPADPPPAGQVVIPAMGVDAFAQLLEDLTIENHEYHKQMAIRSNRLADFDPGVNVKPLVDEIQEFKAKRNAVGLKIAYLKENGRLPEAEPAQDPDRGPDEAKMAFLANLPVDRYELNLILVNQLKPKLYRANKSLKAAKSEALRAHYAKEAAKCQALVDGVKSKLSAMA